MKSGQNPNYTCPKPYTHPADRRRRGASLAHLLAVIASCGALSAILFPSFASTPVSATVGTLEAQSKVAIKHTWTAFCVKSHAAAIFLYHAEHHGGDKNLIALKAA